MGTPAAPHWCQTLVAQCPVLPPPMEKGPGAAGGVAASRAGGDRGHSQVSGQLWGLLSRRGDPASLSGTARGQRGGASPAVRAGHGEPGTGLGFKATLRLPGPLQHLVVQSRGCPGSPGGDGGRARAPLGPLASGWSRARGEGAARTRPGQKSSGWRLFGDLQGCDHRLHLEVLFKP